MINPISPQEAIAAYINDIPEDFISVVNDLISKAVNPNSQKQYFAIKVKDVVAAYKAIYGVEPNSKWLDFEPLYRKTGWRVNFDKPAYNESYDAFYRFET